MTDPRDVLTRIVADRSVADSLAEAVAAGTLRPGEDGVWLRPPTDATPSNWIREQRDASRNCRFHMGVMFNHVYRKRQVPAGCATCFKVKVVPRSLRELIALHTVSHALPYTYKCGLDAASAYTSGLYGGYFYVHGLEAARAAHRAVRQAVDRHPKLGDAVTVFIKRGCTEYEVHCGPSDRFTVQPDQAELEAALFSRIRLEPSPPATRIRVQQTLAHWIREAYRLGDDSYLDFTGGRRLYPAVVRYAATVTPDDGTP
ncbi:hypothetical protein F11_15475 [Rhodospirillum rubrum F11]|uniref:Uncharacterized protein n=1 Tax=Rhodospirillum rubrum (strain ATCC 11170 / ATH 1.1.1 / DSM 467 / LMG 4362 / NCIMB 8255 / S1) TaxID=269796 RepID=Q2RPX8_RHORT|nr:hypothetical protein [Rhodospirillum rubrum]ABC23817.1 hypothetical protein Rru_A3022 [Rhodospirillum rubrum ATCC 11170]AEO49557.1 hypothetical protein F11_15475 [Rhodospirillum rubrum F11]MBK5955494.1 hypothetical protein [Rhodospirillum rubrum]QXG79765.1 hypothetical protein KUL73_15585 [Rhodospirillum rubrum]HAQ00257.1 hypothetical protein [Rhodospirillum rubrum]